MKSCEPKNLENFTEQFQAIFRTLFSKPRYVDLGKEVKDEDEKLEAIVGFWQYKELNESEKLLLLNLGVSPDQAYFKKYNENLSEVYFERDGKVLKLNFGAGDFGLDGNLEERLKAERKHLMDDCYMGLVLEPFGERDWVFYDTKTGRSFGTTTSVELVDKGLMAEKTIKVKHRYIDDEGNDIIDGLFCKVNHTADITTKERKVLEGIIANEDLKNLKVTAPEIYGSEKEFLFMKNLDYGTVEEYLKSASEEKRKTLLERIVKATEVIESKIIEKPTEGRLSYADHFGEEHSKAIAYLKEKGLFDRELSDSRLNNWLYDEENDVLYKVDENAPKVRGSKYSCIARIADFAEQIPEDERDKLLETLLKEGDKKEDAFLSLYITSMDTALIVKEMLEEALAEGEEKRADYLRGCLAGRLERAKGYLDRLNDEKLRKEYNKAVDEFFKV